MKVPRRFVFASIVGFVIAAISILGGLLLEGGEVRDVGQVTAALIVFGGTAGAVLVSTPTAALFSAVSRARSLLREEVENPAAILEELVSYAKKARGSGIVSLDSDVESINEPFF